MKKIIFLSLVGILLAGCSTVTITGRKQLSLVSNADVLSMSATSYKQLIDSVPLSTDVQSAALVKKVGKRIADAVETYLKNNDMSADVANYSWEYNLVKDTVKNAFCMPGGKIVVYEGILPVTQNEAGLAVVLGHEVAHAVAKHSNERISQQMVAQYGAALTDMLLQNKSAVTRNTINTVYGIGAQVGVLLPYSRKQELEADHLGLIFMAMAGYDPNEALAFWQRMAASTSGASLEILSTHPSDQNRIAQIKADLPEALKYYKK
ncbi:MAG: M48 family metallopeptidase [Paludibacter sp.]|nr:M48 family metallopeptidase [Paludibacter sp.]